MKRLLVLFLVLGVTATATYSQEQIALTGSNQNQTTLGFEMNEYDYLINPLYLGMLSDPWLFFALDNDVNQLGANIVGDGFRVGWAPGGTMTPVFLTNYRTSMFNLDAADPENNVEITRTGYDTATGQYATITETVNEDIKRNEHVHDLVLHGGLSLSEELALVLQFGMALDFWSVQSVAYTNTYTNTAAISDASLTTRGNRTETVVNMRDNSENSYRMDVEAGLSLGDIMTRAVLGLGWYQPLSGRNTYTQTVTQYNAGFGLDDTVRDQEFITNYTGQYYTPSGGVPTASFTMGAAGVDFAEYLAVGLDSETMLPLGDLGKLTIPFGVGMDIYPRELDAIQTNTIVTYDDSSDPSVETSRNATTTTTTLVRTWDLMASTGAALSKSVKPAENTELHLGANLDFRFDSVNDTKTQTQVQRFQQDNDDDQAYATQGIDIDYTYTESGYEVQLSQQNYTVVLGVKTAVSYSPVPLLTFHAGASTGLSVQMTATSSLTTGGPGFVYEQYTDNLDPTNSYDQRQKNGSTNDSIPGASFSTDFVPSTGASFGFTLNFSEAFKIDARSVYSGNVGFSEFSVLGMYSY